MTLSEPHPRVRIDEREPNTLRVRAPGATIRFTVKSEGFLPLGVAFLLQAGVAKPTNEQKLGLQDFDPSKIRRFGNVLYITDAFMAQKPYRKYKFSVFVQRAGDGALGIIDPDIIHES